MRPQRLIHALISLLMLTAPALGSALTSFASEAQPQMKSISWRLTDGRVVYPGDTLTVDRSTLMTGYTVEAVAASSNGPVKQGLFRAILTAFSPVERRGGQNPDLWYVAGKWTITATNGGADKIDYRQDEVVLEGTLAGEGSLQASAQQDPFGSPGKFMMTLRGNCPGVGEGVFLGAERFEGHIHITLSPDRTE